ncbi:ArsR family transcriptional regulator [Bacteroidota bacterium]
MIETLISSKTRINILLKFFLNPENTSYLRELATEFGESTNAIRLELNRFETAGMLDSSQKGNRKMFKANKKHPMYREIRNLILKYTGVNNIIENIIKHLGNPEKVYLTGDLAMGINGTIIDIIIVGDINISYLVKLIEKVEKQIKKRIRYLVCSREEFEKSKLGNNHVMVLWSK